MPDSSGKEEVGRPDMPAGYGLAPMNAENDLIAWTSVEEKLRTSRNYWIGSTRPDGRPHAMPVWGVWSEGAFFFSTDPESRKGRNLAANPGIVVHLESGDDAIILEGRVSIVTEPQLLNKADQAYFAKYQFHLSGEEAASGLVYRLKPKVVFAWLEATFPTSATRWKFEE